MSTAPMQLRSFDDLIALMNRDGVFHQVHAEDKSVRIPTEKRALDGVLIIRWQDRDNVLQFIHPMPFEVPPERSAAVERAITRINHALALPGFGYNHDTRLLYFRIAAPLLPDGVSETLVAAVFRAAVRTASDFYLALQRVACDGANPDSVVADAQIDAALASGSASGGPVPIA